MTIGLSNGTALLRVCALAFGLGSVTAYAADPAVSDVNFKLSGFGGAVNEGSGNEGLGGIAGNLVLPLDHSLGLQLDGAFGRVGGGDFMAGGAHLFWRDPNVGLFGIYGGASHVGLAGGMQLQRFGIEAERYSGKISFDGAVGYETGDINNGIYGHAKVDYYWTPDLMTSSGFTYEGTALYSSAVEYQLRSDDSAGVSLYMNSDYHSSDIYEVLAGVKVSFGKKMSLMDRHRRQDPASYLDVDVWNYLVNAQPKSAAICDAGPGPYVVGACTCPAFTGTVPLPGGQFLCDNT